MLSLFTSASGLCEDGFCHLLLLWKRKGNVGGSLRARRIARATGSDYDVLLAIDHVCAGRSVAGKREIPLPEQLASLRVERVQLAVEERGTDEQHSARCKDRTTIVFGSRISHAVCSEFGIVTERNLPKILTRVQVDGVECAPGRRDRGIAVRIKKLAVAGEAISWHGRRKGTVAGQLTFTARFCVCRCAAWGHAARLVQEIHEIVKPSVPYIRETRHAAFAIVNGVGNIGLLHSMVDIEE